MARFLLAAVLTYLLGCESIHPMSQVAFAVVPPLSSTYLRYRVHSGGGDSTRQFVVARNTFAELRDIGGRSYALGLEGERAWMRVAGRPPVEIDGLLAADERTEAAWVGMRFAEPEWGATNEIESCHAAMCTVVHTPRDGHALWIDVSRDTHMPTSLSWVTQHRSIEACDDITWSDEGGVPVIASATCSAIVDHVGRDTMTWQLEERRSEPVPPEWAHVEPDEILPLVPLRDVVTFPIADPSTRIYVPAEAGGHDPLQLVLDTGSAVTIISRRVMDAMGVVSASEPPIHLRPPWLPEGTYDPAIVDRLVLGGLELHGVRVLVPREDGAFACDEAGLLGMDLLSRVVVDVDGPASMLRFWPRGRFAGGGFTDLPFYGASTGQIVVAGAVDEIGPMPVVVDTGAPLNVVVGGAAMHLRHPHHRDDDVMPREDGGRWDYMTEIDGFHFGPFGFPRMPAIGHDRRPDLSFLDCDCALVGLGVLRHFRLVVDTALGVLHVAPGPSYAALSRYGIEIDERGGAPTVARIVDGERQWHRPVVEGDVVRMVGSRTVGNRNEALAAIASSRDPVRLVIERHGTRLRRTIEPRD
jgi:hypothetical protein